MKEMLDVHRMLVRKPIHEVEYRIGTRCFNGVSEYKGTVQDAVRIMVENFKQLYPDITSAVEPRFLDLEIENAIRGEEIMEKFIESVELTTKCY